jgi:hypothetical protein
MMASPVSEFLTSSGIFSPRRMFERDSRHLLAEAEVGRAVLFVDLLEGAALVVGREAAVVLVGAGEDLHVHDDAGDAGGHAEGGVLHVAGLLAEDGAEQLLFGREVAFRLRGDLADEDVAGLHLGADADDAVAVEVAQGFLAEVRDVAGDLLGPELGVAGGDFEFLDVDGREDVVLEHASRRAGSASSKL